MARSSAQVEFKNFIKGLVDVASPLNFPDNASFDEENFELNRDGTRHRRKGFDIESGGTYLSFTNVSLSSESKPSLFKWKDAAGQNEKDFLVVQDGNLLRMFDMSVPSLSTFGDAGVIALSTFPSTKTYSFTSVDGRLVVVCGEPEVAIVEFDNPGFSVEYIRIKTRDLWGLSVNSDYDQDDSYRGPLVMTHYYNLQNQSWGIPRRNKNNILIDPASYYNQTFGKWPSNSETVWPAIAIQAVGSGNEPFERIWPNLWEEALGANVKSARGYFIIDAVDRGSSRVKEFENNKLKYPQLTFSTLDINADKTPGGASTVREFAGRVFYAGFEGKVIEPHDRSPNLSNYVFFSQLVKSKRDYERCYQAGDPTSRENADIVETDGGFIRIAGAEQIIALDVIGNSLIVLATNGVWAIVGGSDYGFTASNYRVDKISSFGCIAPKSVVSDGGKLFYWSDSGIYLITQSDLGGLAANSITENTIQNLYDKIDNVVKQTCNGVYDALSKKIRWMYKEGTWFTDESKTYEIVLDTSIGSFYKFRVYNSPFNNYEIVQGFDTNRYNNQEELVSVVSGSEDVLSSSENVVISQSLRNSSNRNVRYLFLKRNSEGYQFSFGWFKNEEFLDWNEVDAYAYLITGDNTAGTMASKKNIPYLHIAMERTEEGVDSAGELINTSGCLFRTQWDWSLNLLSKKWSSFQQAYRLSRVLVTELSQTSDNSGTRLVVTKNKTRGSGRSFALRFETEPGKNCKLVGWTVRVDGTTA